MAPRPTDVAERHRHVGVASWFPFRLKSWRTWRPDECPSLDGLLWTDAPWFEPVTGRSIDVDATERLHRDWDTNLRTGIGGVSAQNVWGGTPWQDVTGVARPTQVIDRHGGSHLVPLPEVVRRFMDPTGTQNDCQWVGIDVERRIMWEAAALRPGMIGSAWWADAVHVWDFSVPWDENPRGVTATNLPLVAGIPRVEEFRRGYIDHALWFVAARYSAREIRYPARGTDGLYWDSPLVAGQRLVLRPDWSPRFPLTADERTLVNAMKAETGKGFIVSDRTHPDHGSTMRHCMDPRISIRDLGIRHRDLLVLA